MLHPQPASRRDAEGTARERVRTARARYGLAAGTAVAAALLTYALQALLGPGTVRITLIFFFPAVLLSAHYGGSGPALLTMALSALAVNYLFFPPVYSFSVTPEEFAQIVLFLLVASLFVYLVERRRRAEDARYEAGGMIVSILESITDAFVAFDREWRYTYVNGRAAQLLGRRPEELLGENLWEVYPHAKQGIVYEELQRAVREGVSVNFEAEEPETGGLLEVHAYPSPDGISVYFRDVSERKQAERERASLAAQVESERQRLKSLVGSVPGVVWEAWGEPDESSQRINFVSDYAEKMLGYTVDEWLSTPNFWLQVVHDEDRERAAAEAHAIFEGGVGGVSQFRWIAKDGRVVHVESQSVVVCDEEGRPLGMRGVTMDIGERKRAEGELRESEERYRALADAMPQIVWTTRADGYTDYYNRRWYEYTGLNHEQTRGWGWQFVIHPDDAEAAVRRWATSVETGTPYLVEYRFRRASDGQYRWHLGRAVPLRDPSGRVLKWFGTATDIHDQKMAEERLRFLAEAGELLSSSLDYQTTLERLARLAVDSLADYCLIDVSEEGGQIRRVATAHRDSSKEELVRELRRFPPDPSKTEGVPRVLSTGRTYIVPELTEEKLNGLVQNEEHRDLLVRLGLKSFMTVPLITRGRIIGALTFALTGGERSYTQSDATLAEMISRRAALAIDNAQLYGRARAVNRIKDEFLATLSHELRTPLTPVIGWTHMIRSGRLGPQEVEQGLRVIDKNANALSRLINDLLDMSSIMSGKMKIERSPVDLGSVLREAVETVRPQAEGRSVELEVTTGGLSPVMVEGDRTRLVQVFWNLLNNAVKFSREGGRVAVRLTTSNGHASVEVADDGQGIESDFLPHVFERFRQADGSTTRAHGGLGIGLALVKNLVEAHGGTVTASSPGPGMGSRFAVTLPAERVPGEAQTDGEGADVEVCEERVCRVLVVEDAGDTLELLRVIFEARGYHIESCASPEEALRVAESQHFDIIVSDIGLPRIDGYELIKRLRRLPHLSETPAVALTGYAGPKDAEAAKAAGFDVHVPKPVEPSTLAAEVEQLLKRRAQEDAGP